jgi:hypothetical protein
VILEHLVMRRPDQDAVVNQLRAFTHDLLDHLNVGSIARPRAGRRDAIDGAADDSGHGRPEVLHGADEAGALPVGVSYTSSYRSAAITSSVVATARPSAVHAVLVIRTTGVPGPEVEARASAGLGIRLATCSVKRSRR